MMGSFLTLGILLKAGMKISAFNSDIVFLKLRYLW